MGYDTRFQGQFRLDRPLAPEHKNYVKAFSEVRHMTWNAELLEQMEEDPIREAVGLPLGEDGQYFTGSVAIRGYCFEHPALASMVIRPDLPPISGGGYNVTPTGVPSLWCHWEPNVEGTAILWNGAEKFGSYISWLRFLLDHFLMPWSYHLNGEVYWQGEHGNDAGVIVVINNKITTESMPHQEKEDWEGAAHTLALLSSEELMTNQSEE